MNKARQMAKHEIEWWKAHHRIDKKGLIDEMVKLYVLLFDIDYKDAETVVHHRVEAAGFHDKAEEQEDKENQKGADIYWKKAESSLYQHFLLLEKLRKR